MSNEFGFGNTTFKEKPDISMIFLRQLDRTNMAASRDYETSVIQKQNNLPMTWYDWVEEQADRYREEKLTLVYKQISGVKMGTREDPCLFDETKPVERLKDGTIDWDDPNILSPKLRLEEYVDYTKLDCVIMEASEHAGLTWNQDTETFKIGTIQMPTNNKATPYRPQLEEEEESDVDETEDEEQETES